MDKKKCVFAGTFDPPTLGHKSVVENCLAMFDEVVIALLVNPSKAPFFTASEREEMWNLMLDENQKKKVRIVTFSGTVTELLEKENTKIYVRGIRDSVDLAYENANFYASKKLDEGLITLYLPCPQEYLHVSSSMVRNSLRFNTPIDEYVTKEVKEFIENIRKK